MTIPKEVKKFADVNIGDQLSSFTIDETQETIDAAVVRLDEDGTTEPSKNIHNDPEFAKEGIFSTTVNGGVITMSYIAQMLEQDFPRESFFGAGSMLFKAIEPFSQVTRLHLRVLLLEKDKNVVTIWSIVKSLGLIKKVS